MSDSVTRNGHRLWPVGNKIKVQRNQLKGKSVRLSCQSQYYLIIGSQPRDIFQILCEKDSKVKHFLS